MDIATKQDIQKIIDRSIKDLRDDLLRQFRIMMEPLDNDWMTSEDIMKEMTWARRTFDRYRPEIPLRKIGKKLLIRRRDFYEWLNQKFDE